MDLTTRQAAPQRRPNATCSAVGTARDRAVAALLATSRDYFALPTEPVQATRAGAAAGRRR